jgi:hypothetical protein
MTSLKSALSQIRALTRSEAKKMLPKHVSVEVKFNRDIKSESDGYMRPLYYPDGTVKFNLTYNVDLIEANLKNLNSSGMKGLVVHELAHVYDFIVDKEGFVKSPHKNKYFTGKLAEGMGVRKGTPVYRSAMQPDVSTVCAIKGCKQKVAPAWLSNYWLYFCKDCGYYDAYVTDLRAKLPVCENCGSHNLIKKKMSVPLAAKMDQAVTNNPKAFDTDGEIKRYIIRELESTVDLKTRKFIKDAIKNKKWLKAKRK